MPETTEKAAEKPARAPRSRKPAEEVVMEFPHVGKYRVRLLRRGGSGSFATLLDVREYVQEERFTGFTRRGIRLHSPEEAAALRDILDELQRTKALVVRSA